MFGSHIAKDLRCCPSFEPVPIALGVKALPTAPCRIYLQITYIRCYANTYILNLLWSHALTCSTKQKSLHLWDLFFAITCWIKLKLCSYSNRFRPKLVQFLRKKLNCYWKWFFFSHWILGLYSSAFVTWCVWYDQSLKP